MNVREDAIILPATSHVMVLLQYCIKRCDAYIAFANAACFHSSFALIDWYSHHGHSRTPHDASFDRCSSKAKQQHNTTTTQQQHNSNITVRTATTNATAITTTVLHLFTVQVTVSNVRLVSKNNETWRASTSTSTSTSNRTHNST